MSTNLLISYQDVPATANIESSTSADADRDWHWTIFGSRNYFARIAAAATTSNIIFDMESGNTATPNHLICTRLAMIVDKDSADITVTVEGDDNASFTSSQSFSDTPGAADLIGPESDDWVLTFTPSGGERYWRVTFDTTDSFKHEIGIMHLGAWLDLGIDPSYENTIKRTTTLPGQRKPRLELQLTWEGLTAATVASFMSNVFDQKDIAPVYLYDQNDYTLNGDRLLMCYLKDARVRAHSRDSHTLTANFEEII